MRRLLLALLRRRRPRALPTLVLEREALERLRRAGATGEGRRG